MSTTNCFFVGVDVGGTKIFAGACDENFSLITSKKILISEQGQIEKEKIAAEAINALIIRAVREVVNEVAKDHAQLRLGGIGIGVPGPIDKKAGIVISTNNLPNWRNVPLAEILNREFACPVFLEKDGHIAALGEYLAGAGRGTDNLAVVTVGTGVGCGLIVNGEIYSGRGGAAGELGHIVISESPVKCGCGNTGCREAFVSGANLVNHAAQALRAGRPSRLREMVSDFDELSPPLIAEAAEAGDELCLELIKEMGHYLGIGLVSLINLFSPDKILLGGGISRTGDLLINEVRAEVKHRAWSIYGDTPIERTALDIYSGIYGGAALPLRHSRRN
ncbi:MAG: ROK family protein [Spirochaetales bacterium]|jgi:glucokinase|nr:ROK family protein [Spirochaetales bacterium]